MSIEEIHQYVEYFGDAARRGQTAGFEIIDIHAACGVLLSNFLSPRNNRRNDMYGGSLHNRARFLIEVIRNIKKKAPGVALSVRLSGIDFEPEGITIEETVEVAKMCEAAGADAINITWGSHAEVVNAAGLLSKHGANHVEAAQMIKDAVSIPTMLCGGIYSPEIGEELLENGVTDFVGLVNLLWLILCGQRRLKKDILRISVPASDAALGAMIAECFQAVWFSALSMLHFISTMALFILRQR